MPNEYLKIMFYDRLRTDHSPEQIITSYLIKTLNYTIGEKGKLELYVNNITDSIPSTFGYQSSLSLSEAQATITAARTGAIPDFYIDNYCLILEVDLDSKKVNTIYAPNLSKLDELIKVNISQLYLRNISSKQIEVRKLFNSIARGILADMNWYLRQGSDVYTIVKSEVDKEAIAGALAIGFFSTRLCPDVALTIKNYLPLNPISYACAEKIGFIKNAKYLQQTLPINSLLFNISDIIFDVTKEFIFSSNYKDLVKGFSCLYVARTTSPQNNEDITRAEAKFAKALNDFKEKTPYSFQQFLKKLRINQEEQTEKNLDEIIYQRMLVVELFPTSTIPIEQKYHGSQDNYLASTTHSLEQWDATYIPSENVSAGKLLVGAGPIKNEPNNLSNIMFKLEESKVYGWTHGYYVMQFYKMLFEQDIDCIIMLGQRDKDFYNYCQSLETEIFSIAFTSPYLCITEKATQKSKQIEILNIQTEDNQPVEMGSEALTKFHSIAQNLKSKGKNVFVHCTSGVGRSGSLAYELLVITDSLLVYQFHEPLSKPETRLAIKLRLIQILDQLRAQRHTIQERLQLLTVLQRVVYFYLGSQDKYEHEIEYITEIPALVQRTIQNNEELERLKIKLINFCEKNLLTKEQIAFISVFLTNLSNFIDKVTLMNLAYEGITLMDDTHGKLRIIQRVVRDLPVLKQILKNSNTPLADEIGAVFLKILNDPVIDESNQKVSEIIKAMRKSILQLQFQGIFTIDLHAISLQRTLEETNKLPKSYFNSIVCKIFIEFNQDFEKGNITFNPKAILGFLNRCSVLYKEEKLSQKLKNKFASFSQQPNHFNGAEIGKCVNNIFDIKQFFEEKNGYLNEILDKIWNQLINLQDDPNLRNYVTEEVNLQIKFLILYYLNYATLFYENASESKILIEQAARQTQRYFLQEELVGMQQQAWYSKWVPSNLFIEVNPRSSLSLTNF